MRKVLAFLTVLFATNAWAFRGRPVSNLRFDGRASTSTSVIASDGADFLVLSSAEFPSRERVFTQKVVDGKPVGPHRQIGRGGPAGLIWTGNDYLAAWKNRDGLWVAPVSRDGSPLATPTQPAVLGDTTLLTANRTSALAFGYTEHTITAQPLDLAGRPSGNAITHSAPAVRANLVGGAAANGFALVFSGWNGTWLMLFRADGTAITNTPIVLDGPYGGTTTHYHSNLAAVATDGSDTLVVFGAGRYEAEAELKSVVVGANGTIKSARVIHAIAGAGDHAIAPVGLAWDGTQYIVAINVQKDGPNGNEADPGALRIARNGERVGELTWLSEVPGWQKAMALGSNAHELLVTMYDPIHWPSFASFCVAVNPATMQISPTRMLARTLPTQEKLALAPGYGGYLAAWIERADGASTLRASRIDAGGNYLDGDGIVLDSPAGSARGKIAIDGNGAQWLVVWSDGTNIRGRFLSRGGVASGATIAIGYGSEVAVRWDGSQYVVLYSDGSLRTNTVSASGNVGEEKTLAELEQLGASGTLSYREPRLVLVGNRVVAVYTKELAMCGGVMPVCGTDVTVTGLRLDQVDAAPFVIAEYVWGEPAVAESATQAVVTWSQYQALRGAFFSADGLGASFQIDGTGTRSSVAFDGTDFVAAWWLYAAQDASFATARIAANGSVSGKTIMRLDDAEYASDPVVAASAGLRPLVGFLQKHPTYDNISRGGLLFTNEIETTDIAPPHEPPRILCATGNADGTITVRWDRVTSHALGVSIELQLSDGTFREIGVAPSFATRARVSPAGLEGSRVRLRSYNTGGFSPPSGLAPMIPPPQANLRWSTTACAGVPTTIEITLDGTAPFTVRWEDGLVQSNLTTSTATRVVTLTHDTTFTIVSVSDATCATNEAPESVRIAVNPQPAIAEQTHQVRISRGGTAALTVTANEGARFAWFEGARGDTSHPVGTGAHSFTTPPLTASTRYWVRVSNRCGSVDSQTMNVAVSGRRRSARP
ncbi:MAG TPA: hypothetical protein VGQ36_23850 [Thermoanaerobaculia bacterium]|jgi:hypothetical protein|nr:hypothetical protein [Thermoanaerobaculia bacterium]